MSPPNRHHRFQALAAFAVIIGLMPVLLAWRIADGRGLAGAFYGWTAALYLCATAGTLVAALTFDRGEPMRRAWLLVSAAYLVLIPSRMIYGLNPEGLFEGQAGSHWTTPVLGSISGVLVVGGVMLLARAWRSSGLDQSSRAARVVARAAALAVAAALVIPDVRDRLPPALAGDLPAAGDVLTDLLDGALFVVAVPVLRAALGLGGGLVAWPWILITGSLMAWLGYDATLYGSAAGFDPRTVRIAEEVCRSFGAGLAFAAGVAQRWVMTAAD
jgi:hypothetical protein